MGACSKAPQQPLRYDIALGRKSDVHAMMRIHQQRHLAILSSAFRVCRRLLVWLRLILPCLCMVIRQYNVYRILDARYQLLDFVPDDIECIFQILQLAISSLDYGLQHRTPEPLAIVSREVVSVAKLCPQECIE